MGGRKDGSHRGNMRVRDCCQGPTPALGDALPSLIASPIGKRRATKPHAIELGINVGALLNGGVRTNCAAFETAQRLYADVVYVEA